MLRLKSFIKEKATKILVNEALCKKISICINLLILTLSAFAFLPGRNVTGDNQISIAASMITISAIIFGVIGAWLALMKLDAESEMKRLAAQRLSMEPVIKRMQGLSQVIVSSSIILFVCLGQLFMYHITSSIDLLREYAFCLKGVSFSILVFMALLQAKLIFKVLWLGMDNFVSIIELKKELIKKHR